MKKKRKAIQMDKLLFDIQDIGRYDRKVNKYSDNLSSVTRGVFAARSRRIRARITKFDLTSIINYGFYKTSK